MHVNSQQKLTPLSQDTIYPLIHYSFDIFSRDLSSKLSALLHLSPGVARYDCTSFIVNSKTHLNIIGAAYFNYLDYELALIYIANKAITNIVDEHSI